MKHATLHPLDEARIERLAGSLREHGVQDCALAFVLGSGLGAFAARLERPVVIEFAALLDMPRSAVPGHAGKLVVGEIGGTRVVVQQGRVHLYEGWSANEVTRCVRALARVGVRGLVLTNAAGGLRTDWSPGTLMRIEDHLALQGVSPLAPAEAGARNPWDARLGTALDEAAVACGVQLERGVYAGLLGPTYETPAEVRMLRWMGADAVGMSTVAEASAAHVSGLRVCGISCITNLAAGLGDAPPNHEEVVEEGRKAAGRFCDLLGAAAPRLVAALG